MNDTLDPTLPTESVANVEETIVPTNESENQAEALVENNEATVVEPTCEAENETEAPVGNNEEATAAELAVENKPLTKEEILERLTILVGNAADTARTDVDRLKAAYYKIRNNEVEELRKAAIEENGEETAFEAPMDEFEEQIKEKLAEYKEKRAALLAEDERVKAANYALKLQLIEQIKELSESQEDFNKLYNSFKDIQTRWKEVKEVPQEHANTLWKEYQVYCEKFYDIIKINNEFRYYDFKKNLEIKTTLCENVEKLIEEADVVSSFHQLQKLHQQWREAGPVARHLREDLWTRFKTASTVINKRHQEHFETIKAKEQTNLEAKTSICEKIESIDTEALKTFKQWDEKSKEIIALQEEWKTIGFTPKKFNVKIFERFRAACDAYFAKKSEYYKSVKDDMEKNLEKKRELCEKVEALKDSTEWKETTDKMIALQKEWKTIGTVSRKHSDAIWKRFITACDAFFEEKNKNVSSQKSVEHTNLAAKKDIIERIKAIDASLEPAEAIAQLKEIMAEWNTIGHVPFKEKDKLYKEYREAADSHFDRLKVSQNDRKMQNFRSNLSDLGSGEKGKGRLLSERDKLMRILDRQKNELQTYENNMGFLNISSKGGSGLLKEMERKNEQLKNDIELTIKKINAIDDNLE